MDTLELARKQHYETSYEDIDLLLRRAVDENMPVQAVKDELVIIAIERYETYKRVRFHLTTRLRVNYGEDRAYTPERVARISPELRYFLGLNVES